jgi:hypothetical protein
MLIELAAADAQGTAISGIVTEKVGEIATPADDHDQIFTVITRVIGHVGSVGVPEWSPAVPPAIGRPAVAPALACSDWGTTQSLA